MKIFFCLIASFLPLSVVAKPSPFIWGGIRATNGQFPFQISLQDKKGLHICGGAILNNRWIITAAHCIDKDTAFRVYVRMGSINVHEGTKNSIVKTVVYPNYDSEDNEIYNDIALAKVQDEIHFSKNIQPIKIHEKDIDQGRKAIASGWGFTQFGLTRYLMYVTLLTISNEDCQKGYDNVPGFPYSIKPYHLCTIVSKGAGTCSGDSGGPLTYEGKLIGITSFGAYDCATGAPDGFTRVSMYKEWIENIIHEK